MPRFRPDLEDLVSYVPGRPIEQVAAEIGIHPSEIVKLASNESPEGPFPGVAEAVASVVGQANRYPDVSAGPLTERLAARLGVGPESVWFGAGSTGLLTSVALGLGGPGTSAVYAWPSFIMYRIISRWAATEPIEVPLTGDHTHDLVAMHTAIRPDTSVVYVCNPNNPTGTVVSSEDLAEFSTSVPPQTLVVVDEAYHDFVEDPRYTTMAPLATEITNLVVLRTFSKVFGLAAFRLGYAVGHEATLTRLRQTQAPFTVTTAAQVAALASLADEGERRRRVAVNARERRSLLQAITDRGLAAVESQTNFIYFRLGDGSTDVGERFVRHGVIVRPMASGWVRVTVGTPNENSRFLAAVDAIVSDLATV